MLVASGINAQSYGLISELSDNQVTMTTPQQQKFQNLQAQSELQFVKFLSLGSLSMADQNGSLTFSLPTIGTVTATAKQVRYSSESDYTWAGEFTGTHHGYMGLVSKSFGKCGFFQIDNRFFSLIDYGQNKYALIENIGDNKPNINDCAVVTTPKEVKEGKQVTNYCDEENNTCAANILMLVLITPEAQAELAAIYPNPFQAALSSWVAVLATNLAFVNSDIPNKTLVPRFQFLPNFDYATSATLDDNLDADYITLSTSSIYRNIRLQNTADLVVMLTNSRYTSFGTASLGPAFESSYGIITAANIFSPRWTFPHEVGHLFGADHNVTTNGGNGDEDTGCNHGLKFTDNTNIERRTILALLSPDEQNNGSRRELNYSNPNIIINGASTGQVGIAENSRIIRNTGCVVDGHFGGPFGVQLWSTASPICRGDIGSNGNCYAVVTLPGQEDNIGLPPYTYEWKWSTSPTNWFVAPFANTPSIFLGNYPGLSLNNQIWLRVTVTSSDGLVAMDMNKVTFSDCLGNGTGDRSVDSNNLNDNAATTSNTWLAKPNPTSDIFQIDLTNILSVNDAVFTLTDARGISFGQWKNMSIGQDKLEIDISNLPAGIFYLQLKTANQQPSIQKIIHINK